VLEDRHYDCQYLGDPIFVDVASLGSYSHRPWWIWTNLAPLSTLAAVFFVVFVYFDRKVDDILDPNRTSLLVVRDDLPPLALVNKVGTPRRAFPTLMTFLQSFAFRDWGPGMVCDAHTKIHTEPLVPPQLVVFMRANTVSCNIRASVRWVPFGEKNITEFDDWPLKLGPHLTGAEAWKI
jgi:hypothetical protein